MARVRFGVVALVMWFLAIEANAQDGPPAAAPAQKQVVAATVAGEPLYVHEVMRFVRQLTGRRSLMGKELSKLQAEALSKMVERRYVFVFLSKNNALATKYDVDQKIKEIESQLASQNRSLDEILKQQALSEDEFRRQLEWGLSWSKHVEANLTDAKLEKYFLAHRREFDGTEVQASHIILLAAKGATGPDTPALIARIGEIRKEITDGKISFADAAKKYSEGPSGPNGGGLGFFPRHGAMVEEFSQAAFALDLGEVSQAVTSSFGVHLIQVTEHKPGTKQWSDVRNQLTGVLQAELFEKLAKEQATTTQVEYTGAMPRFKPGTRELVMPGQGSK